MTPDRRLEIAAYLERADQSIQAARDLAPMGYYDFAASRAYYAAFYGTNFEKLFHYPPSRPAAEAAVSCCEARLRGLNWAIPNYLLKNHQPERYSIITSPNL